MSKSLDADLSLKTKSALIKEVRRLRQAIRAHRDASGHNLCWYHPELWSLLPEASASAPKVPEWPEFLRGCIRYRQSLDNQLPRASRTAKEYVQPRTRRRAKAHPRARP